MGFETFMLCLIIATIAFAIGYETGWRHRGEPAPAARKELGSD